MTSNELMNLDAQCVMQTYGRFPVAIDHGEGACLYSPEGKKYIDFTSGIGVNCLGYGNKKWLEAISAQAAKLAHASNLFYTAPYIELAHQLTSRTGMKRAFFANGGGEANEGMIKLCRKYSYDKYGSGRSTIITLRDSFHGRTITTLTATGQDVFHHDFGPFPANFDYVPAGDFAALEKAADADTCAVMLELVQGEGGVVALDADYVARVAAFCREKDILFIVDEVQTGVGRTGRFLACEHFGLKPDIVTLAKGLGGGLPIGAVVMNQKVAAHMGPGSHGSTFGGNPVCCAGALAVLDTMDEAFLAQVRERAAQLRAGLAALPHVQQVSGLGLMVGIELADGIKAAEVRAACEREGLLVLTAKTRLRLLPPLILTADDVAAALATLRRVLENTRS